jgi:hypothetical protein
LSFGQLRWFFWFDTQRWCSYDASVAAEKPIFRKQ